MSPDKSSKYTVPVIKKDQPDDTYKFQPLPTPTGQYPYRLSLQQICPEINEVATVFHMFGDTGSIVNPAFQHFVAAAMAKQYETEEDEKPQFLYHLGDVVYTFGEADKYSTQFFEPYQKYPGPIFAIAGNHDSDVNPNAAKAYKSLDAFKAVFCDTERRPIAFGRGVDRKSMIQPNIYWTLKAPLANIIGLHSNVPKFGVITPDQRKWFKEELKAAALERSEKALIVTIHHAPYTADVNHGSSIPMIQFLEEAFEETGVFPDIVFSGHVHNYQRFTKTYKNGKTIPFIVAGAGGYDELHPVAQISDPRFFTNPELFKGIKLENYADNKHGFLKIAIKKSNGKLRLAGNYYTIPHEELPDMKTTLTDQFLLNL
ncbi:3',5'-cyclic AMP phosphodiesterase CpdA [Dyadobacter koreensis]|uniref:3',5'-cyclic AMP phosphodiesterase CpdA n=1 Tax=Dyadobacter koreensis TaxID=408657 RepID=A0A1H6W922_9BACT|nr:metallophosphoesterase [Dyadobacter koreensis]SEJ13403.1 3',5'-cyclic AMP phosphodiesterase CpdA [Dyadobacter koreensis]